MSVFGNTTEENLREIIAEKEEEIRQLKNRNKELKTYYNNTKFHIKELMKIMSENN